MQCFYISSDCGLGLIMFSHFIGATDIWQPVDAGYGFLMKKLTAQAQNRWLEEDDIETGIPNIDRWNEKKLSCSERRILITEWVGNAVDALNHSNYDNFRWRCFEKTGILITADGSEDEKIQPEGLTDYKVPPPLPMPGPFEHPDIGAPEPAIDPLDVVPEDELFSMSKEESIDLDLEEESERLDDVHDRIFDDALVGKKIRGHYETGWHIGKIDHFNAKLKEYAISFDDGSSDYIKKEDIDGSEIILIEEECSIWSGRRRNKVDYKKMANM